MLAFAVRRLAQSVLVIFGVLILAFVLTRVVPSDPGRLLAGPHATVAEKARVVREAGLDRPIYVQLGLYLDDFAHGNLGRSYQSKRPILAELRDYLPPTLELLGAAMLLAIVLGLPLGILSADKKDRWPDHVSRIFAVGLVSIPTFFLALVLQYVLCQKLRIMPIGGQLSDETVFNNPVHTVTGFVLVDSILQGNYAAFWDACVHLALPALALCGAAIGTLQRMTRSAMVEILSEDYITASRSYGLPERSVLWRFALKNSLGPTATIIALTTGYMLVNTFLVEAAFSWPGIGNYIVTSVLVLDYNSILGVTILSAIAYVILNTIADLVIGLDPRARSS